MTRRAERTRRVAGWGALLAAGLLAGAAAWLAGWGAAALLPPIAALAAGHRAMIAPPGVAILTYHSVSADPGWLPWSRETSVHPATFARHLETLAAMRVPVLATRDLVARRAAGTPVPPRAVVLHFDDGYRDNHREAAPALRRQGFPATFFPSLDFVRPDDDAHDDEAGYMTWRELADLARDPLFEVEPHGVAHARVAVSTRAVDTLDAGNWRRHAWVQWAATPGPKHDWFRPAAPVAVPLGAPVPESRLALASPGLGESDAVLEARVASDLAACARAWEARLGYAPAIFCWPENKVGTAGRRIAAALGYRATTGGGGRNCADEPAEILSRIHVGDRALGFRWLPAESLALRAAVRLMHGNHYWYLVLAPISACRRLVFAWRRRFGSDFV